MITPTPIARFAARTQLAALATLILTTLHHLYEAHHFHMPERGHHVVVLAAISSGALVVATRTLRRRPESRGAFAVIAAVSLLVVVGVGVFESAYGHAAKNAFYLAGASPTTIMRLFPPPTWAPPSDVLFELTGVLQMVPAFVTGFWFYRLARAWRA